MGNERLSPNWGKEPNYIEENKTELLYHTIKSDKFHMSKGPSIKDKTITLMENNVGVSLQPAMRRLQINAQKMNV